MATLTGLISAVSEPSGLWATIIKAFESGVGSYILAVLLLTIIIRVVWAPVDTFNKKSNKKMMRNQAKLQPQLEKLEKQYGKDPNLLNRKKQELYKKANAGLGGGCLFMIIFMALNLTIFGTMFTTMNAFSSYKVYDNYEVMKDSYANVLNVVDGVDELVLEDIVENYKDVKVVVEKNKISLVNKKDSNVVYATGNYVTKFETKKVKKDNKVTYKETKVAELINTYIKDDKDQSTEFIGGKTVTINDKEIKYSTAIQTIATNYTNSVYEKQKEETSFLWVGNIWVADSPFKQSVLDFNAYKGMVGDDNVATNEELIYNSFMATIKDKYNTTNGYFILAIISVGITYLSMLFSNGIKKKKTGQPEVKQNKAMMIIMPLIMGVFAIMYNSVFAFYLVASQAINVLLTPLENLIIDKWEARDMKKEEEKNTVEYSRKKI